MEIRLPRSPGNLFLVLLRCYTIASTPHWPITARNRSIRIPDVPVANCSCQYECYVNKFRKTISTIIINIWIHFVSRCLGFNLIDSIVFRCKGMHIIYLFIRIARMPIVLQRRTDETLMIFLPRRYCIHFQRAKENLANDLGVQTSRNRKRKSKDLDILDFVPWASAS